MKRPLSLLFFLVLLSAACQLPTITRIVTPVATIPVEVKPPSATFTPFQPAVGADFKITNPVTPETTFTDTLTSILTATGTLPVTQTPTITLTGTVVTLTPSLTFTSTPTSTPTLFQTNTLTPTKTLTSVFSLTVTFTRTVTRTATVTRTITATFPTSTRTITRTATQTFTPLPPAATRTASATPNLTLVVPTAPVTPMQLIDAMNQLRVANGFPALRVNQILMGTAQWTAEYMAANHLMDHIGNVRGRVADAGYGSGATVFATENWAMGFTTLAQVMTAWSDPAHMLPATYSYYVDVGAGVATGPWGPYYILHAAYSIGTTNTPTTTPSKTPTRTFTPTSTATPTQTKVPATPTSAVCNATTNSTFESELAGLINQQRVSAGLPELAWQGQLAAAARGHSLDMACNNYFSHTGSDGSSPFDRIIAQGYSYSYAGENIYGGGGTYNSPQAAFDAWMASPGHHDIMLSPTYTQVGIGYAYNAGSTYGGYFTAVFAVP